MGKIKTLHPFLYKNFKEAFCEDEIYVCSFPPQWSEVIEKEKKEFVLPFQPRVLSNRLQSIFPEIIYIRNNKEVLSKGEPWIISREKLSDRAVISVVLSCIKYSNLKNFEELESFVEINWQKKSIADLEDNIDYDYTIYPAAIAHDFCSKLREVKGIEALSNRKISFFTVRSGKVFEAVSEPLSLKPKSEKFSYVLRFELITRGGENEKLLKITPGARRYYQKKNKEAFKDVRSGCNNSIYISHNHLFTKSDSKSYGKFFFSKKGGELQWENNANKILSEFSSDIPPLSQLLQQSKEAMHENKEILIGYSDRGFFSGTNVKAGISVKERNCLVQAVIDTYPTLLQVNAHHLVKLPTRVMGKRDYKFIHSIKEEKINVHLYVEDNMFEILTNSLLKKNYIMENEGAYLLNSKPRIVIDFKNNGNDMIHELPPHNPKEKKAAIKVYKEEVKKYLPNRSKNALNTALIEIEPYHEEYGKENVDSKDALREFFLEKGILSQFIHPISHNESNIQERCIKGFLDLLSDIGVAHIDLEEPMFNNNSILFFTLIQKNSKEFLPVLALVKEGCILYKTIEHKQWVSLPDILQKTYSRLLNKGSSQQLMRWLESEIIGEINCLKESENLYFVLDAKLRNNQWVKEMANSRINIEENPFQNMNILNMDKLKVIRINQTGDIPNYYINNDDDGNNYATGLYKNEIGIYYSIGEKMPGLRRIKKDIRRIERSKSRPLGKQRALEIIPISFSNEEEQDYMAIIIHRLRHMALTLDAAIRYPVPMHLVQSVKKYIGVEEWALNEVDDFDDSFLEVGQDGQLGFDF